MSLASGALLLTAVAACGTSDGGSSSGANTTATTSSGRSSAASSGARVSGASSPGLRGDSQQAPSTSQDDSTSGAGAGQGSGPFYPVASIVDGDTIKVRINGKKQSIRLIGVDTPETKKPNTAQQCFGKQASSHIQSLVQSRSVQLVADPSQADKDKYGRLLRYVFVGSTNVSLAQIEGGFGREYTYDTPYEYQSQFRSAQQSAQAAHRGTWGAPCHGFHRHDGEAGGQGANASTGDDSQEQSTAAHDGGGSPSGSAGNAQGGHPANCDIKGNINSRGEKIAHLPGSSTYNKTVITPADGERWFCSANQAIAAGWRIARD